MIELDKYEQNIILACKSWGEWAKREDRYKAVRIVIGQYYAIAEEELGLYTIYNCLLELFVKIKQNRNNALQNFMENIFKDYTNGGYKREIDMLHIIKNLISSISEMAVKDYEGNDLFNELEVDEEILNKGIEE
jgi:hypothetical protein